MGLLTFLLYTLLILMILGFYFFRSSKEFPKTWYEWKTEFRFQYMGILGLIQDISLNKKNNVAILQQTDRIAIVTGGNRGIGLRIIEKLLECEMTVIMACRDPEGGRKNILEAVDFSTIRGKLICEKLDVASLSSVKEFAKKIQDNYEKIDLLINNAGIMCAPYKLTEDGYESHFAVNFLGHFLLTHLLLPKLKAAGKKGLNARIVNVSSIVNMVGKINYDDINLTKKYYPPTAYNQSKLAQVLTTKYINHLMEKEEAPVQVHAVHPGLVDTDLFKYTSTTSVPTFKKLLFKTPEEGSRTVVYAAIGRKLEGKGGTYLTNCVHARCHPDAKKPEKCEKFFKFSCDLLGIKEFGNGVV
ncbi:dehydrogenase/reductase SDR family member on chromosome X [Condylostylus longicornis]|uniref:dehydrogenase/reductase SDR family member on chromosome X n=1 Tax=Condylostylus longicornis TaxID=2530218 RepID=UPI00244DEC25|nr:dehydrogenase/reductase SDR family member on chromosome X [Condylostylus longicornis]